MTRGGHCASAGIQAHRGPGQLVAFLCAPHNWLILPIWMVIEQCAAPILPKAMMLTAISAPNTRFILLIQHVHLPAAKTEIFDHEETARERWRECAIAAITGNPVDGHLLTG